MGRQESRPVHGLGREGDPRPRAPLPPPRGGSLSADVWIENLLDRRYETFGYSYPIDEAYTAFYTEFFPAASRGVYFGVTYGF